MVNGWQILIAKIDVDDSTGCCFILTLIVTELTFEEVLDQYLGPRFDRMVNPQGRHQYYHFQ